MRVAYFGSGGFSAPSLRAVLDGGHELAGVFTQPPRPAGRGSRPHPTPVARAAREAGLPLVECPDVNRPEGLA